MFGKLKKKVEPAAPAPVAASAPTTEPAASTGGVMNGILLVRVAEARNLTVDGNNANLPYAVIEFDKNEFVAETTCMPSNLDT